ncbi:MAG: formylglycine-generating enzyme family protein [Marinilabiliaceae bacterium]|nr:formylglycine-generating enzyme family protein [Marinilabiliaceae bacterium]
MKRNIIVPLLTTALSLCIVACDDDDTSTNSEKEHIRVNQKSVTTDASGNIYIDGVLAYEMTTVEHGSFYMGSQSVEPAGINYRIDAQSAEGPVHKVTISNDYLIGITEVTQDLWIAVMGTEDPTAAKWLPLSDTNNDGLMNRNYQREGYNSTYDTCEGDGQGDKYPAYWLDYDLIDEFITELNKISGGSFRLPTEAEWEYAANGGNKATIIDENGGSRYHLWAGSDDSDEVCVYGNPNFEWNSIHLMEVKSKKPNELGIYDMSGNVWEWTADYYSSNFYSEEHSSENAIDPICTTKSLFRCIKGGGWESLNAYCYNSYRGIDCMAYNSNIRTYGLRLAADK